MKLNLGCGNKKLTGYVNVDKYKTDSTDLICDLENTWPWESNSIDEIIMEHSLEHMGQTLNEFKNIITEIYRVLKNKGVIKITVPHFRHDNFWHDPTHVRVITPTTIHMFNQYRNLTLKTAETKLGVFWNVDFEVLKEENRNNEEFYIEAIVHKPQRYDDKKLNLNTQIDFDNNWSNNVGQESRKTWYKKYYSGFWDKYCQGNGLDIGFAGYVPNVHPILPTAIGVDTNYPGYDGKILPFPDNSQDYVYSSHFLEHVDDYKTAIREQFRVVKPNGFIIIVVPSKLLYEKKDSLPSRWNADHKRMYQPSDLLREIEESLIPNSYRVRHLRENDENHDYNQSNEEHSKGEYEIEVVIQKR